MYSSQNKKDLVLTLYGNQRNVFRLKDISMLTGIQEFDSLNKKLNYLVKKQKLLNPRKGIYAKPGYTMEELACNILTPSYLSLGFVLQEHGITFQYSESISMVSYASRTITIDGRDISFRKIKGSILTNTDGIEFLPGHISKAIAERAFLDTLYLQGETYFDNLNPLKQDEVFRILPLYESTILEKRVKKLMKHA